MKTKVKSETAGEKWAREVMEALRGHEAAMDDLFNEAVAICRKARPASKKRKAVTQ